jgi:CBS domain-containing protein
MQVPKVSESKDVVPAPVSQNPLKKLLSQTTVQDIISTREYVGKEVVSVDNTTPLAKAVSLMTKAHVSSLPVLNQSNVFLGFLDLLDIAKYILASLPGEEIEQGEIGEDKSQAIDNTPVNDLLNLSQQQPKVALHINASGLQAAETLLSAHRTCVFTDERALVGVCSQSDINRWLSTATFKYMSENPELAYMVKLSLHQFGLLSGQQHGTDPHSPPIVLQVPASEKLSSALAKLTRTGASCLAVTDPHSGKLIGNFSLRDLHPAFTKDEPKKRVWSFFKSTIGDYLKEHSPQSLSPVADKEGKMSLQEIMQILAKKKLHHLWITSAENKPQGVVTLTDILRIVTQWQPPSPAAQQRA